MPVKITGKGFFGLIVLGLIYAPFIYWLFFQSRFPYEGWDAVIPAISVVIAFLNYRDLKKDNVLACPDKKYGLLFIIIAALLKVIVFWRASYFLEMFSFISTLSGLLVYFYGWKIFSYFTFPLAFLLLKLPWDAYILNLINVKTFNSYLAKLTAWTSTLMGFSSKAEGVMVVGPQIKTTVIDRCSGLYTLTAKCLFGFLFIYYSRSSLRAKLLKSLGVIPIIQFINLLRIVSLHIAFNFWAAVYSSTEIHEVNDIMHKVLLIAVLYVYAFGFRNKKNFLKQQRIQVI